MSWSCEFAFGVVRQLFEPLLAGGDAEALLSGAAAGARPVFGSPGDDATGPARDASFASLPSAPSSTPAGARPRTAALQGPEALTASERRVAALAADGRTNRDIAQALYVTPKTVELHLSNAYRKLGIRSRRELPVALAT